MKIVVVMLCLLLPNLVDILYKNMAFIPNNLIKNLINSVYWYYHDDLRSEYSQRIANSGADVVQRIIFFSFAIGIIIIVLRFFGSFSQERKTYNTFVLLLCVATLGCVSVNTPQYWRFTTAVMISGTASALLPALRKDRSQVIKQITSLCMMGLSLGGLSIQIWNSRYIVDYIDWGIRFLLTDIYVIIGNIIRLIFIK